MSTKGTQKTCKKGHRYSKNSDCPTCPICEEERRPEDGLLSLIVAPARRALERENIKTVADLSKWTEREISNLHGMGPSTIPKLKKILQDNGLSFKSSVTGYCIKFKTLKDINIDTLVEAIRDGVEHTNKKTINMATTNLKDGDLCKVIAGTHKGKSGLVQDIKTSKTGHITITVSQKNGVRFKTLGKNAEVTKDE